MVSLWSWCTTEVIAMRIFLPARTAALFLVMFAISAIETRAQAVSGNINGTVTDSSGAAVPGATVSITDKDRGTAFGTTTNAEGNYSQIHLLAGRYEVKVVHEGFSPFLAEVAV